MIKNSGSNSISDQGEDFDAGFDMKNAPIEYRNKSSGSSSATGSSGKTFGFSNSRFSAHSSHVKTFESFNSETESDVL